MAISDEEARALRAENTRLRALLGLDGAGASPVVIAAPDPKWVSTKRACFLLASAHHGEPNHRTVKRWALREGFGYQPAGAQWRFDENRIRLLIEGKPFERLKAMR